MQHLSVHISTAGNECWAAFCAYSHIQMYVHTYLTPIAADSSRLARCNFVTPSRTATEAKEHQRQRDDLQVPPNQPPRPVPPRRPRPTPVSLRRHHSNQQPLMPAHPLTLARQALQPPQPPTTPPSICWIFSLAVSWFWCCWIITSAPRRGQCKPGSRRGGDPVGSCRAVSGTCGYPG